MILAGNKTKRLSSINNTTKTIHHPCDKIAHTPGNFPQGCANMHTSGTNRVNKCYSLKFFCVLSFSVFYLEFAACELKLKVKIC